MEPCSANLMIANFERQFCKKPQLVVNRHISWSQAKLIGSILFWRLCSMLQCYHVKLIGRILFCKRISGFSEDTQDGTNHSFSYRRKQYQHNLLCPKIYDLGSVQMRVGWKRGVALYHFHSSGRWVGGWVSGGGATSRRGTANILRAHGQYFLKKYFYFFIGPESDHSLAWLV